MRSRLLVTVLFLSLAGAARGDAQIEAATRALRSDSSLKVRAQAAIILGQRGAREAPSFHGLTGRVYKARGDAQIEAATRALRSDSSLKVRAQAAIILGQRGAREAVGALADAARNDSSEAVRLSCISALAKIGDPAGRGAIEAALRDEDARVRAAAEKALQAFAGPGPVGPGSIAVLLEDATGKGDDALRSGFRTALERHLREQGFNVVARGQKYVLRPSVLRVDVEKLDGKTVVTVRASLVAVDGRGGMTAMLEGGAKLKAVGTVSGAQVPTYAAKAMDVAARTLTDDLKGRLQPEP